MHVDYQSKSCKQTLSGGYEGPDAADCLSSFSKSTSVLGMRVSWLKTKLQNLGTGNQPPAIFMFNGNVVDYFIYLCSMQSSDGYCRSDI